MVWHIAPTQPLMYRFHLLLYLKQICMEIKHAITLVYYCKMSLIFENYFWVVLKSRKNKSDFAYIWTQGWYYLGNFSYVIFLKSDNNFLLSNSQNLCYFYTHKKFQNKIEFWFKFSCNNYLFKILNTFKSTNLHSNFKYKINFIAIILPSKFCYKNW